MRHEWPAAAARDTARLACGRRSTTPAGSSRARSPDGAGLAAAAACAASDLDPDCWFTDAGNPAHTAAKRICCSCPVRRSCLAHALAVSEPAGIWGGADEAERAQLQQATAEGVPVAVVLGPEPSKAVA
jgi:WhiB family redox-sensing transcriptional regulator